MPPQRLAWPWDKDPTPPPTYPAATALPPGATPEQKAQYVLDRWLSWKAGGSPVASDNKTPLGPDGKPEDGIPTEPEFDAARQFLASKASTATTISAPPDAQFIVHADGTYTVNPNYRAPKPSVIGTNTTDQFIVRDDGSQIPNPNYRPPGKPNVSPGEGTWDPNANGGAGGYTVPVPAKPTAPTAVSAGTTERFILRQNADGTTTQIENPNYVSPQQTSQLALNNSLAEINARARAEAQAAIAEKQSLIDSGIEMKESDKLELQNHLADILAQADAERKQAQAQFEHDLNQPNVQAGIDIQKQNADTNTANAENDRVYRQQQSQQAATDTEIGVDKDMAAQGQSNLQNVVKAGSAIPLSAGTFNMAIGPLALAFQAAHRLVSQGALSPTAIPTPMAPQPAGPAPAPSAPLPAPGLTGAPPDFAAASINDPSRGY